MSRPATKTAAQSKSRRWLRWLIEACLIVTILFSVNWYRTRNAASGTAPIVDGRLLNGSPVLLQSYRGRPLLVHFWATWCPICRAEQSTIKSLSEDHQVLTIAMQSGSAKELSEYMRRHQLAYPVVNDQGGSIARRFGVTGVPASFVIDRNGKIRFVEVGYTTELGLRVRLWWAGVMAAGG